MADEKLSREATEQAIENVKEQAGVAREALKGAASAIHGLNQTLAGEAIKAGKAAASMAAEVATDVAEIADPLTGGAASRINEAGLKAAEAAGEALGKAYEAATDAYEKAFDAAAKAAAPKKAEGEASPEQPENGAR